MTKHVHADIMLQYANDAMETDKPWERWQFSYVDGKDWLDCNAHPKWAAKVWYRRKPKTIRIGDCDVPEPLRVAPEVDTEYWVPAITYRDNTTQSFVWADDSSDRILLKRGLVHLTEEAAELHAKALIRLTEQVA
jgi:hypothetical protein